MMAASTLASSVSIEPSSRPTMAIILLLSHGRGSFAGLSVAKRSIGVMELESGRCVCTRSSRSENDVEADLGSLGFVDDLEWFFLEHVAVYEARSCLCAASIQTRPATYRSSGWYMLASNVLLSQGQGYFIPKRQAHRVDTSPVRTESVELRPSKLGLALFRLRHLNA
jgi:hypothetical protein